MALVGAEGVRWGPHSVAYGWACPWAAAGEPPATLDADPEGDEDFEAPSAELVDQLEECRWLFPPEVGQAAGSSALLLRPGRPAGSAPRLPGSLVGGGPVGASRPPAGTVEETVAAPTFDYNIKLQSDLASDVIRKLLLPFYEAKTTAEKFRKALEEYVLMSYKVLTSAGADGQAIIPENDRKTLLSEAQQAMAYLVEAGHLQVEQHLVFCLEVFGITKSPFREEREQDWLTQCIRHTIEAALFAAKEKRALWKQQNIFRIDNETEELFGIVDVRAWPHILELLEPDSIPNRVALIDRHSDIFKKQVRLQLCIRPDLRRRAFDLEQAASLIARLRQAPNFGAHELRDIFNDRQTLDRQSRHRLLALALQGAPRWLKQELLSRIDGDDVEISERDDEEIVLVRDLIRTLKEDIRCCRHAYFKMKSDWLVGRWNGVVAGQELTPEQVCDHLEDEDNYEELLRTAVNKCLRENRKFEAARMLARPASKSSRVFETHRNDKQLAYLISLYQEIGITPDSFGPIEEACLALPCSSEEVLYVDSSTEALDRLENDLLSGDRHVVGIWWFWRCFDAKLDLWPRASFMALTYGRTFVIVDFERLEKNAMAEERGKGLVKQILVAPHLVKVVHDIDQVALGALQRALLLHSELRSEEEPVWSRIEPLIDVNLVAAFARRRRPRTPCFTKLSTLTFDYLRLELCLAEALSNFERRPLRQSQLHYALTMAWCPVMILRVLCAYEVVTLEEILYMSIRAGFEDAPKGWDDALRTMPLSGDTQELESSANDDGDLNSGIVGPYAENAWNSPQWVATLPKPDRKLNLPRALATSLGALLTPRVVVDWATEMAITLQEFVDQASTSEEMEAMYKAYHDSRRSPQGTEGRA